MNYKGRTLVLKSLPDGRVCIHWFVRDENGPIKNPAKVVMTSQGPKPMGGGVGYIACNPKQNTILPQHRGMEILLCCNSDDVRAASCPACLATPEAKAMLERLGALEPVEA